MPLAPVAPELVPPTIEDCDFQPLTMNEDTVKPIAIWCAIHWICTCRDCIFFACS